MTHPDASPTFQSIAPPAAPTLRAEPARPDANRPPVWFSVLGVFIIMLLLLSFQQVVQGAVNQGVERHKSTALLAKATRLCKDLRDGRASERCTQQLDSSPSGAGVKTVFLVSF